MTTRAIVSIITLLLASSAFAQDPADPKFGTLLDSTEEVPALPGDEQTEETGPARQTPPTQESVIGSDAAPVEADELGAEPPAESQGLGDLNQPQFNRDAAPLSTEEERRMREGAMDAPRGGLEVGDEPPGSGVQATEIPAPDAQTAPTDVQPTEVPLGPPPEVRGEEPESTEDYDVAPDVVPDRRFETFDSGLEGGTPTPRTMPEGEGVEQRGTPEAF